MRENVLLELIEIRKRVEFATDMVRLIAKDTQIERLANDLAHLSAILSLEAMRLSTIECALASNKEGKEDETQRDETPDKRER